MPAAIASDAAPNDAEEALTSTLGDVVAQLYDIPASERSWACRQFIQCASGLDQVKAYLTARPPAEEETLVDQNRLLAAWLAAYYAGASASPSILRADMLDAAIMASGTVAPFVHAGPNGAARFGVPTIMTPALLCDNASELLRMASAALVSLYVFLNYVQRQEDLPPDEVVLIFSTIAIQSCSNVENAAAIDAELAQLFERPAQPGDAPTAGEPVGDAADGQPLASDESKQQQQQAQQQHPFEPVPELCCRHIKWLMHWARSVAMQQMGGIAFLLGNEQRQAECLEAAQKDHQHMVKAMPANPLGYSLFGRSCMNFQQMGAAAAFLARGLQVAAEAGDDQCETSMSFQLAVALLMGGKGQEVAADEVLALVQRGETARISLMRWWPAVWAPAALAGDPDRSLLATRLSAELDKQDAGTLEAGAQLKALKNLLYVTKPPTTIAPGALVKGS